MPHALSVFTRRALLAALTLPALLALSPAAQAQGAVQRVRIQTSLGEMQAVYEVLLGRDLDSRNFRRDVLGAGVVEESGEVRGEGRGRPARLYRSAGGHFAVDARERRVARQISSGDDPPA